METLADRISWVLDNGRVANASAWCEKAHVARTYLATYMSRARQGNPSDVSLQVAVALAKAAGVNFTWFALGLGSPDDDGAALPANLGALLKRLPPGTYPPALIRQALVGREVIGEKDLPEEIWRDYLDGLRREARRVGMEEAARRLDSRGIPR